MILLECLIGERLQGKLNTSDNEELERCLAKVTDLRLRTLVGSMISKEESARPGIAEVSLAFDIPVTYIKRSAQDELQEVLRATVLYRCNKLSAWSLNKLQAKYIQTIKTQAEQGNHNAMYLMGRCILTEDPSKKEEVKKWIISASERGNVMAFYNLYILATDSDEEREYVSNGAQLGDTLCKWALGRCIGYGWSGFEQDIDKGLQILRELPKEYGDAHLDIGRLITFQLGLDEPYNPEVIEHYITGAQMGDKQSVEATGICLYERGDYRDATVHSLLGLRMHGSFLNEKADLLNVLGAGYHMLGDILIGRRWYEDAIKLGSELARANNCANNDF